MDLVPPPSLGNLFLRRLLFLLLVFVLDVWRSLRSLDLDLGACEAGVLIISAVVKTQRQRECESRVGAVVGGSFVQNGVAKIRTSSEHALKAHGNGGHDGQSRGGWRRILLGHDDGGRSDSVLDGLRLGKGRRVGGRLCGGRVHCRLNGGRGGGFFLLFGKDVVCHCRHLTVVVVVWIGFVR